MIRRSPWDVVGTWLAMALFCAVIWGLAAGGLYLLQWAVAHGGAQ